MAKTLVNQTSISQQYAETMRKQLETAQMSAADIDKVIANSGLDTILSQKNLGQYFRNAQGYLDAITNRFNENKSLSAGTPDMGDYMGYWSKDFDTHGGVPGLDFIPSGYQKNLQNYLFNPDQLAQWAGFNQREQTAYKAMMYGPSAPTGQGAPAPSPPAQNQGGSTGYGGGGGSSGGTGGQTYGSSKALSTGGSKNLGAPPPPPGMGGGYPPGGGYGGGYGGGGGYQSQNMNFFPQAEWDYVMGMSGQGYTGLDWMQPLFGTTQQFREISAYGVERLNEIDQFQQRIMMEFQNLDLTTPEGQRKQFMLTNELQNLNGKKQEYMDKIMRMQHFHDEMITGLKGLQQKGFDDINAIIRNSRPGG